MDATKFACSEFACRSGSLTSSRVVGFPDPASAYCGGATCELAEESDLTTCCDVATCTAFDITFASTPPGYVAANPSGTTATDVGLTCDAAHYTGTAVLTCDGSTFSSPSGCEPREQCGSAGPCPFVFEASVDSATSYCAGTACDVDG